MTLSSALTIPSNSSSIPSSMYGYFQSGCSMSLDAVDYLANTWPARPYLRLSEAGIAGFIGYTAHESVTDGRHWKAAIVGTGVLPTINFLKYIRESSATTLAIDLSTLGATWLYIVYKQRST